MRLAFIAGLAAALACAGESAMAADRLSDPLLSQLIQNVDRGFDGWKDDLERRNLDDAVIKSAAGAIDVRRFLQDMEKDIDLVKDRVKSTYAAGPEVTALLRRASDVERRAITQPRNEAWATLGVQFSALAGAYGLTWPVEAGASAQRKMDRELADEVKRLTDSADRLRGGALDAAKAANMPQPDRDRADRQMQELKQAAKQLESNLKDHRAVTADATRVIGLSREAASFARGAGVLNTNAAAALTSIESATQSIAVAFGLP